MLPGGAAMKSASVFFLTFVRLDIVYDVYFLFICRAAIYCEFGNPFH